MLDLPVLDDERFSDIVARALGRIPSLCAEWTDFNAHDPGITLIELFAWYKEMQQYQLDRVTVEDLRMLLKLLNIYPRRIRSTYTRLIITTDNCVRSFYPGQTLLSAGNVPFEFMERKDFRDRHLDLVFLKYDDWISDVDAFLTRGRVPLNLTIDSTLLMGMRGVDGQTDLSIHFWIGDDYPVKRNSFDNNTEPPRILEFEWVDGAKTYPFTIVRDETHSLSNSGEMCLHSELPLCARSAQLWNVDHPLAWLRMRITDGGCEETPAILGISLEYAWIVQRQTRVECHEFTKKAGLTNICVCSWLALTGDVEVMIRRTCGWVSVSDITTEKAKKNGLTMLMILIDVLNPATDGANVRVIVRERRTLIHDSVSTGLPWQRISLLPAGEKIAIDCLRVMCLEGEAYHDWHFVDTLLEAGAHDRVFTIEKENTLVFGDNRNGMMPEANAVLIAGLASTQGGDGLISPGQKLFSLNNDITGEFIGLAANVRPGCDWEAVESAAQRLDHIWDRRTRAITAADYERVALQTPGLRMRFAKALPFYEPNQQFRSRTPGTLTVVVVPYSNHKCPMPDKRFLEAVQEQLERYRTIGTRIIVAAPLYVPVKIQAEVIRAGNSTSLLADSAKECLNSFFNRDGNFGMTVRKGDLVAALGELSDVLDVRDIVLYAINCRHTEQGDLLLPAHALPYLDALELREAQ